MRHFRVIAFTILALHTSRASAQDSGSEELQRLKARMDRLEAETFALHREIRVLHKKVEQVSDKTQHAIFESDARTLQRLLAASNVARKNFVAVEEQVNALQNKEARSGKALAAAEYKANAAAAGFEA